MKRDYKGFTITLNSSMLFVVEDSREGLSEEEKADRGNFSTFTEAQKYIDSQLDLTLRQQRSAVQKVDALRDNGTKIQIRGLHRSQSKLLTEPPVDDVSSVYPPVDWIQERLLEREKLKTRIQEINKELRPYDVSARRTYGRIDNDRYDDLWQKFVADLNEARTKANALAEHPDVAKQA